MDKNTALKIVGKLSWIDHVVVFAWVVLSVLMIATLFLVYNQTKSFTSEFWLIIGLLTATWTYPLYTLGYKLIAGLVGNIIYGIFLVFVIIQVFKVVSIGALLLVPTGVWIMVATTYVVAQIIGAHVCS